MTGATSGIGAEALKHFTELHDTLILISARGKNRTVPKGTDILPLDLSSLESVRTFADSVKKILGNTPIDLLILNAGANFGNNTERTVDGFERTFATNHLSHYLLARLLWRNISDKGKLIFTTSDTHDPELFQYGPKTINPEALAHPSNPNSSNGMKAYAASKLCNLLTARYFTEADVITQKGINTIAFNPGITSGTSLTSNQSAFTRLLIKTVMMPSARIMSLFKPQYYVGNVQRAGEALAELALGKVKMPKGKVYASLVKGEITFPAPSQLAQTNNAKELLWEESAKMVELPTSF
ncbi:MAG: dehydrogenase [Pseudooceanicola sp.]|nr:dehydrogenase [Pseudooceanicola sp.]